MLRLADILFTLLHLAIIAFNLFGWIWKRTRKAHIVLVLLTIGSWVILGFWFGFGYCPITDWQWDVKERLGERNLPPNFVEYFVEKISGRNYSSAFIDTMIGVSFGLAVLLAVLVNFVLPAAKREKS